MAHCAHCGQECEDGGERCPRCASPATDPTARTIRPAADGIAHAEITQFRPGPAGGAVGVPGPTAAATVLRSPTPAPPTTAAASFGRYRVLERVGSGGMGEVYRAHDETLARDVALKVMRPDLADEEARARFRREAAVMARLQHPNIVPVHDSGEEAGALYYTMELIEGDTLRSVIARMGRLPERTALAILRDAALGVHFAHARGILHRDLKPDNLLLAREESPTGTAPAGDEIRLASGPAPRVRALVMDFGLARDAAAGRMTQSGAVMGTLLYMSPEQAAGARDLGPATDVYSLGATLYEALAGVPPLDGSTPALLLDRIARAEPEPLRRRVPGLGPDAATVCEKALAKELSRRYATALEFAEDLERCLRGEPVRARPVGLLERTWRRLRRDRAVVASAAVLLTVLAALVLRHLLTPGTIAFRIEPAGARIAVGDWAGMAAAEATVVDLRPGVYDVRVEAPEHEPEIRTLAVERGRTKDFTLALRHHQGTLEAEALPHEAEIAVDGVAYGSRIRRLALDTGRHRLRVSALDRIDRETEIEIRRGEERSEFLWLCVGTRWTKSMGGSPLSAGAPERFPDVDGDGIPELVLPDLQQIILCSPPKGQPLLAEPGGNLSFLCRVAELGGAAGTVILAAREENRGLVLTCFDPRRGRERCRVWEWTGPPQDWRVPSWSPVVAVPDRTGDGVRELAIGGRDGAIWFVDGRTGSEATRQAVPVNRFAWLAPLGTSDRLLFAGRRFEREDPTDAEASAWTAGCLSASDGSLPWAAPLGAIVGSGTRDLDGDGVCEVYTWGIAELTVREGTSGAVRWTATLPAATVSLWDLATHDLDRDGTLDFVVATRAGWTALGGKDGRRLWQREGRPNLGPPWAMLPCLENGVVVAVGEPGLLALSPADGETLWSATGRFTHAIVGRWDADDREVVLAAERNVGIRCLDADGRSQWVLRIGGDRHPVCLLEDLEGDGRREILFASDRGQVGVVGGPDWTLWQRKFEASLLAAPVLVDVDGNGKPAVVQVGAWSSGGNVTCFDGASGRVRWSREEMSYPNRPPGCGDVDGDRLPDLVLPGWNAEAPDEIRIWVLRGRDGERVRAWPHETKEIYSTPALADLDGDGVRDAVLQRWHRQDVAAINGRTGESLWRHPLGLFSMGEVGVADLDADGAPDLVAPCLRLGEVHAIRGRDGTLLWKGDIGAGGSRGRPEFADLTGDGIPEVLLVSRQTIVWVLDGRDGSALWQAKPPGWREGTGYDLVGSVRVAHRADGEPVILAPCGKAGAVAFDWANRRILWRSPGPGMVDASPVPCDLDRDGRGEVIVAYSQNARFDVLDLESGRRLWGQNLGGDVSADPVVGDLDGDGVEDVVLADRKGILHAISGKGTLAARRQ